MLSQMDFRLHFEYTKNRKVGLRAIDLLTHYIRICQSMITLSIINVYGGLLSRSVPDIRWY